MPNNVIKRVLLSLQLVLFISLLLLNIQISSVQGAGLKIKTANYGQWETKEIRTGSSPLDEEGWLKVTVTKVIGYELEVTLEDDTNQVVNITLADVNNWYAINSTYFFITTNWEQHEHGWLAYFASLPGASAKVTRGFFFFHKSLPRDVCRFSAIFSSGSALVQIESIYDRTSGTLLKKQQTINTETTETVYELTLLESNISHGFSFVAILVIIAVTVCFILFLSISTQKLRKRRSEKKQKKQAVKDRPAYYTPPSPVYSFEEKKQAHKTSTQALPTITKQPSNSITSPFSSPSSLSFDKESEPLPSKTAKKTCPFCGSRMGQEERFCPKCGGAV